MKFQLSYLVNDIIGARNTTRVW